MQIQFTKYQGTGNDFVLIDNRYAEISKNDTKLFALLCHRKFGIGADGVILIEDHEEGDFEMIYYNADGNLGSMCGNGARCAVHFAASLDIIENKTSFMAYDGFHYAEIDGNRVSLQMGDVEMVEKHEGYSFVDTGSPHHVQLVKDLEEYDVINEGRKTRNEVYGSEGSNVNYVEQIDMSRFKVRTYERGVEDETLSCGTGVTAVAIAMHATGTTGMREITLQQPGGELKVRFDVNDGRYEDVHLIGPATVVFTGRYEYDESDLTE